MTIDPSLQLTTASDRNRTLTRRMALLAAGSAALVFIPLVVTALITWEDINGSDDPWAGLGLIIVGLISVPLLLGALISLVGLVWSRRTAGPVLAGIGLGINVLTVLFLLTLWVPALA